LRQLMDKLLTSFAWRGKPAIPPHSPTAPTTPQGFIEVVPG